MKAHIKVAEGAKLRIGKHRVRPEDQTRFTVPTLGARRQRNRRRNAAAKRARRANR